MVKRLEILLCAVLVMSVIAGAGIFPVAAGNKTEYSVKLSEKFENCEQEDSVTGIGSNYAGNLSGELISDSRNALYGKKSLSVSSCDLRWWTLNIDDLEFRFEISFMITPGSETRLDYIVGTQDPDTSGTPPGCALFSADSTGGAPVLCGFGGKKLADIEYGVKYTVDVRAGRGENTFDVYLNNSLLDEKIIFMSGLRYVTALRVNVTSSSPASRIVLDDITVRTGGRKYPQKYSTRAAGAPAEAETPGEIRSGFSVYVNGTRITCDNHYITAEGIPYIGLDELLRAFGIIYKLSGENFTVNTDGLEASAKLPGNMLTVNGNTVTLPHPAEKKKGVITVPPCFINELLNAYVYYDEFADMLVITTGKARNDGILRTVGGKFYMNGKPYYEISFNKFDLFYQIFAEYFGNSEYKKPENRLPAAEDALKMLSEKGFKSIRIFCGQNLSGLMYDENDRARYFEAMDALFDLCDKYNIKIVASLMLSNRTFTPKEYDEKAGWVNSGDSFAVTVSDPSSEGRRLVKEYVKMFAERYKDRKTILMYEIDNENNLECDIGYTVSAVKFSLDQLAEYYGDVASAIHSVDSERLVTGGDSAMRPAQWNLYKGVCEGMDDCNWKTDTPEENLMATSLLNSGLDAISIHAYRLGSENAEAFYADESGKSVFYGFDYLADMAKKTGKPLYIGETNASVPTDAAVVSDYLDKIISAGIQLTHWWTFHSDREGFSDGDGWQNTEGPVLESIISANKELKEKYISGKLDSENAFTAWSEDDYTDFGKNISVVYVSKPSVWPYFAAGGAVALLAILFAVFNKRVKKGK